jgi:hypothetical protein
VSLFILEGGEYKMIKRRNIEKSHRGHYVLQDFQASSIADKIFGICPVRSKLIAVKEVHGTAGSDGGAVTLSIERLQGTETSGNGDAVVNATINLKGTADTVQSGTIVNTSSIDVFEEGNRVGINVTGTTTSVANMAVVCYFLPYLDGE